MEEMAGESSAERVRRESFPQRHGLLLRAWLLAGLLACVVPAAAGKPSFKTIYDRCHQACVEILVAGRHSGCGWFARPDGWVISAAHIFQRADLPVEILSPVYGRQMAKLQAIDRGHDVALLKIAPRADGYATLPLARAVPPVGREIYQFGSPLFRPEVLQAGRIARTETAFEYYGESLGYVEVVHVAGMMQGGTSGGPWLNRRGEVIGAQSGTMSMDGKPVGIAYLTLPAPIRTLLRTQRNAATPFLGLGVDELWQQPPEKLKRFPAGTQGLVVARLQKDGPAARAGLSPDDVIVAADNRPMSRIYDFVRHVRQRQPGDIVRLRVLVQGKTNALERKLILGCAENSLRPPEKTP